MSGSSYTATLGGFRIASLMQGDTIERVAYRELGDASQWQTLVGVNGLTWPYLTDDPGSASATVLLTTGTINVPASQVAAPSAVTDASVFGTDLQSINGQLQAANGDLVTVSGLANLSAAIIRRIVVKLAALPYHPDYGCLVTTLKGGRNNAALNQLAAAYVARTVKADPRISSVASTTADLSGDQVVVTCDAVTVSGKVLPTGRVNVPN